MICTNYQPAYERAAAAGALTATQPASRTCTATAPTSTRLPGRPVRLLHRGRARRVRAGCSTRRSTTATTAGWRTSASTRRSTRSPPATAFPAPTRTTPIATRYHCAAYDADERRRAPIVRFQRSGWTGAAACAQVVWGGDPTTGFGFDGLRSAVTQALSARHVGHRDLGLGHRRLLRPRREPADAGAAHPLGPARRRLAGDAHPGQRGRGAVQGRPAGDRPRPDRQLAPLHEAAHPALPVPDRGAAQVPPHGHAADAPPRARLPARPARRRRDDEFLLGPDLLAAPVLERAGPAQRLPAARPLDRPLALAPRIGRRAAACASARPSYAAPRRSPSRRRSRSCRCSFAPARCCRCCRRGSTRSPATATASRASTRWPRRATALGCSPFPAGAVALRCMSASRFARLNAEVSGG